MGRLVATLQFAFILHFSIVIHTLCCPTIMHRNRSSFVSEQDALKTIPPLTFVSLLHSHSATHIIRNHNLFHQNQNTCLSLASSGDPSFRRSPNGTIIPLKCATCPFRVVTTVKCLQPYTTKCVVKFHACHDSEQKGQQLPSIKILQRYSVHGSSVSPPVAVPSGSLSVWTGETVDSKRPS